MKKVFLGERELLVFDSVYGPRSDSYLLAESVKVRKGCSALDMGCGCGIQAISMALQGAEVTAVDINPEAVKNTEENAKRLGLAGKITAIESDLFSALKGKKFGLIAFNPPYLPEEGKKDIALDGGKHGWEIMHNFLDKLSHHMKEEGECFFTASSLSCLKRVRAKLAEIGLNYEVVNGELLFFEELAVFKAIR